MNYIFNGGEKISVKDMGRELELIAELNEINKQEIEVGNLICEGGYSKLNLTESEIEEVHSRLLARSSELYHALITEYGRDYSKRSMSSNIIYGDDYKIRIEGNCLIIKDYNENQELEAEISIKFSREELNQLADLLRK